MQSIFKGTQQMKEGKLRHLSIFSKYFYSLCTLVFPIQPNPLSHHLVMALVQQAQYVQQVQQVPNPTNSLVSSPCHGLSAISTRVPRKQRS